MKTKAFAVYDLKAVCYGVPFFMGTVGLAVRAFTELVNDPKSSVHRYPGDFTLYQIGEFDDEKGVLIPLEHHVNLGLALEYYRQNNTLPEDRLGNNPSLIAGAGADVLTVEEKKERLSIIDKLKGGR